MPITRTKFLPLVVLLYAALASGALGQDRPLWVGRLEEIAGEVTVAADLPSFAIVVVDRDSILATIVVGHTTPSGTAPATVETLYRTGSVGKTLTDLAVLASRDAGRLDLDVPVTRYLPDFRPRNPHGGEITLRYLMTHTAGLVREPPVGNYFDDSGPSLAETVASLNHTTLLWEPGSKTKYSNAGLAVVGRVLEMVYHRPFAEVVAELVFKPAGMRTARVGRPAAADVAAGVMWGPDGRIWDAPTFDLGMVPAGDFYTSLADMASLMRTLLADGGGIVRPETYRSMWTPYPPRDEWQLDVGLGFSLNGKFDGSYRMARHGGAVYGFATELALLPEEGLGVYAVAAKDVRNDIAQGVAHWALRAALAARSGDPPPEYEVPDRPFSELSDRLADCSTEVNTGPYAPYVGVYGPDHNPLTLCVRDGRLNALMEWFFLVPLTEQAVGRYTFPSYALYGHEDLWFEGNPSEPEAAIVGHGDAGVRFDRVEAEH